MMAKAICALIEEGSIEVPTAVTDDAPVASGAATEIESIFTGMIDCAVALRAAIRDFILANAGEKHDEVEALLCGYSKAGDRKAANAMCGEWYCGLLKEIYVRGLRGINSWMQGFMHYVPNAALQKAIDALPPEDSDMRDAIRQSVLMWDGVAHLEDGIVHDSLDNFTAEQAAMSLVGADEKTKDKILHNLTLYDEEDSWCFVENSCREWEQRILQREMEKLIEQFSKTATQEMINAARDEMLFALTTV